MMVYRQSTSIRQIEASGPLKPAQPEKARTQLKLQIPNRDARLMPALRFALLPAPITGFEVFP